MPSFHEQWLTRTLFESRGGKREGTAPRLEIKMEKSQGEGGGKEQHKNRAGEKWGGGGEMGETGISEGEFSGKGGPFPSKGNG